LKYREDGKTERIVTGIEKLKIEVEHRKLTKEIKNECRSGFLKKQCASSFCCPLRIGWLEVILKQEK